MDWPSNLIVHSKSNVVTSILTILCQTTFLINMKCFYIMKKYEIRNKPQFSFCIDVYLIELFLNVTFDVHVFDLILIYRRRLTPMNYINEFGRD